MDLCIPLSFFLSTFFLLAHSSLDFPIGSLVSVPVPSIYQPGFKGRAYVLDSLSNFPNFRAALSVEAINGDYFCSLIVLFDDLKVWATDHVIQFIPVSKCVLELTQDGDLQLKDQFGLIGWQSDTSHQGVKLLHLQERIGNLALIDESNQITWQSFAHPTDTILWGQQLNASSPLSVFPTNTSVFYSFEIVQEKIVACINWRKNKYSYWQFKPHGNRTIGSMRLSVRGLKIFNADSHKIAQILSDSPEPIQLFTIGVDGNLEFYHYSMNMRGVKPSQELLGLCDLPLPCGLYGICSPQNTCRYLQSESIRDKVNEIFEMGMYNGICELLQSEVEMVRLKGVETILRTPFPNINISEESCVSSCMENCACDSVVYSHQDRSCFQFGLVAGGREVYGENGESYWVKMQKQSRDEGASTKMVKKVLIICGVLDLIAIFIVVAASIYYYFGRGKKSVLSPGTDNN